jgi:endoplasmic reticulum protein 29
MCVKSFLALLFAAGTIGTEGTALGALKLDNYTFEKVTQLPGHSFFVKFDQSYAYGEKEDEFKLLCKTAYSAPKFLIAEVPVQEYGDKENDDLREKFKLKKDDFPAYFLFNEAHKDGLKYTGAIKASDMAAWLRRQKIAMPSIGTIAELDEIAQKFMNDGLADVHIEAAKKLVEESYKTDKKAQMYPKIMEKIKAKGEVYVTDETKRVTKMMEGKIAPEKKTEFSDKLKVLGSFTKEDAKPEL